MTHRVFESGGRRFAPERCLRRSAAWVRSRDLPEPPLSSGPVAHLWHILNGPAACSMYSSSIPMAPHGAVGTVTATGGDLRTRMRDSRMTNVLNAQMRTPAAADRDARLHGRASADSVPSPTQRTSVPSGHSAQRTDSKCSRRPVFSSSCSRVRSPSSSRTTTRFSPRSKTAWSV
jgi:hypothetical protein